jgi:hypothetical protein
LRQAKDGELDTWNGFIFGSDEAFASFAALESFTAFWVFLGKFWNISRLSKTNYFLG